MLSFITPTHNIQYLQETYQSLLQQNDGDWEWVLVLNGNAFNKEPEIQRFVNGHKKVRILKLPDNISVGSIGAVKHWAFMQGKGAYLAELDHDDLLVPTAVKDLKQAFKETNADFIYSNTADFFANGNGHWFPFWQENGWRYRDTYVNDKWYNECISFPPSAASMSLIYSAPNHIRCWKKDFYRNIGGHNPEYIQCDDHELCVRTYLCGKVHHLNKLLYLYRMHEQNTFSQRIDLTRELTNKIYIEYVERLIARESEITDIPIYHLGRSSGDITGWKHVDWKNAPAVWDFNQKWPLADNSALALRIEGVLEFVQDKNHVVQEIFRCLQPGGWVLLQVPSTDGRAAFMHPNYASYWNENSFRYYTQPEFAATIDNKHLHFMEQRLFTFYPTKWHEEHNLLYVKAELRAQKGDITAYPGIRRFPVTNMQISDSTDNLQL